MWSWRPGSRSACLALIAGVLATACASNSAPSQQTGGSGSQRGETAQTGQQKTLRMGMLSGSEPTTGIVIMGQSGTGP